MVVVTVVLVPGGEVVVVVSGTVVVVVTVVHWNVTVTPALNVLDPSRTQNVAGPSRVRVP
jgi:hypothetical protein